MADGVSISDMHFCGEPTADFDTAGEYLRVWYERNRETWWERNRFSRYQQRLNMGVADSFMLGMLNEAIRIEAERVRQTKPK